MQLDNDIIYKKGKENATVDALSRLPIVELHVVTVSVLPI